MFEDIWRKSLTDYRRYSGSRYGEAWGKRQRLRGEVDRIIYRYHNSRDVIRHFRDTDRDIPIWAVFEVMTLGNFGAFYECLDGRVKTAVVRDLGMPTNMESERLLLAIIYALKDLRNAIAHNGVVLDVRFKSGKVNTGVAKLLEHDAGVTGIDFTDITDYVVLTAYLMRRMRFTVTECRQLLSGYEAILERYRAELPFNVYSKIIRTSARRKIATARDFAGER